MMIGGDDDVSPKGVGEGALYVEALYVSVEDVEEVGVRDVAMEGGGGARIRAPVDLWELRRSILITKLLVLSRLLGLIVMILGVQCFR